MGNSLCYACGENALSLGTSFALGNMTIKCSGVHGLLSAPRTASNSILTVRFSKEFDALVS